MRVAHNQRSAERHPESQVIGIDLHFLSPQRVVPDNCSFDVASAEGYWDFLDGDRVDFAFLRYLGWLTDWETIFASVYDNLVPGGWVEAQEWVLDVECADGSLEGTALSRWNDCMHQGRLFETDLRRRRQAPG